ncbi:MAG: antitoxin [Pseudomonadota bacterium]|nr:antitoxin [Pseudomonadota bacterium]
MKKQIETPEETKIIEGVENGEYKSIADNEFLALEVALKKAAVKTVEKLSKRKAINIRLLESDIEKLKGMALNEGMPYQTYISHMIHKLTTGRLRSV